MKLTRTGFQLQLFHSLDVRLNLQEGNYYEFKSSNRTYYSYLSTPSSDYLEQLFPVGKKSTSESHISSLGLIIAEKIHNGELFLLPSIMSICYDVTRVQISDDLVQKCSKGYSIPLSDFDYDTIIICDQYDRSIGLGRVKDGIFTPLTDIGYYIREE